MAKTENIKKKETLNVTHMLLGVAMLALALYSGWTILQAPDGSGMELGAYSALLREKTGFLGGLFYLVMHGLTGRGILLFPFLFCLCGLCLLSGKQLSQIQVAGVVMAGLAILTMLHMNVTYVNIKDNFILGLCGNGGGVLGAAISMLLQKALGTVGAYIVLFCVAVIALIFMAYGLLAGQNEMFFAAIGEKWVQMKEKLLSFIFIEEEDEEEEMSGSRKEKDRQVKKKSTEQREEKIIKKEKAAYAAEQAAPPKKESRLGKLKRFFVEDKQATSGEKKGQYPRYTGAEYVVIPKEHTVVLNSLAEIHKALDEQEPRVGLSPREPLKKEPYYIADSVEDFRQLLEKRQIRNRMEAEAKEKAVQEKAAEEKAVKETEVLRTDADNLTEYPEEPGLELKPENELPRKVTAMPRDEAATAARAAAPIKGEAVQARRTAETTAHREETMVKESAPVAAAASPLREERQEQGYRLPSIDLLDENKNAGDKKSMAAMMQNVEQLEKTLNDFGVKGKIVNVSCGPAITQYEFRPAAGVKVSKIINLADDIALSMAVAGVRIEAPIPGKAAVGIEVPNKSTTMVGLREVLESDAFQNSKSKLTVALGKDISGQAIVADLAKMPHLLIAGSTGSGKSVCINTLINSILYKATPDEVKFVMVDPKKVELGNYNGIPHLISPVVTDAKKAASALRWAVHEMDRRYEVFATHGVKDMTRFNRLSEERRAAAATEEERDAIEIMPYIVVLIDELADLMMVAPADVEDAICRLAQLARAAGIHLVVATQRPSVDVITGIIKANMPSRIAFAVSSQTDSRTILDMGGAEKLLGRGDMLFYPTGMPKPQRVQGVYVSDQEIERITEAVKNQAQPVYNEEIGTEMITTEKEEEVEEAWDELIPEATKLFIENGQASISLLQRRFRVGYTRAARIVDQMEQRGLVGPYEGSKPRQIKVTMAQYTDMVENGEL